VNQRRSSATACGSRSPPNLGLRGELLAVLQQREERRLVRDDRAHEPRAGLDEGECGDRAAARTEHRGRSGVEVIDEAGEVVRAEIRGRVLVGIVERAAVDAPRIGGDHGVVGGEQVGERRERRRVHRGAGEHHERAGAAHLVVQVRARDGEGRDGGGRRVRHRVLLEVGETGQERSRTRRPGIIAGRRRAFPG
jgi:hypothetical protein